MANDSLYAFPININLDTTLWCNGQMLKSKGGGDSLSRLGFEPMPSRLWSEHLPTRYSVYLSLYTYTEMKSDRLYLRTYVCINIRTHNTEVYIYRHIAVYRYLHRTWKCIDDGRKYHVQLLEVLFQDNVNPLPPL